MPQEWQKNVHSGHSVVDRNGKSIGTVKNVHQVARAAGGPQMGSEGYVEVESTLPNLSKTLYIPFESFRDCTGNSCYLNLAQDELANKGWDRRPIDI